MLVCFGVETPCWFLLHEQAETSFGPHLFVPIFSLMAIHQNKGENNGGIQASEHDIANRAAMYIVVELTTHYFLL